MSDSTTGPTNRLIHETSPYLLQHARNPVDWYPWGPEALELARTTDRPIFLSIGYSACHWCHVMERESFEDERIAGLMNQWFVNVKVDREERPDLDDIYMKACQAMTGQGGWPLSAFLTPDLEPFFCGTYFPPDRRFNRPGFPDVLAAIHQTWTGDREKLTAQGRRMVEAITRESEADSEGELDANVFEQSFAQLERNFDPVWGGFGNAPKFPHAMDLRVLLRHHLRTGEREPLSMVTKTLDRMADGGVYDQLGGGFHRYSTDEMWLIPHFEKMLYDNALLVPVYLEAHLATGVERYARVARECCDWVLREMTTPEGGFASTQDADSEGEEGKFFAWTPDELLEVLGRPHGVWAAEWFGVTEEGNFEGGTSALWRHESPDLVAQKLHVDVDELTAAMDAARAKLLDAREARVHPATDDKVLAAWNGLAVSALAQAHQVLGEARYLEAAQRAARYVTDEMRQPDGRLFATARGGRAHLNAYLDDYAFTIQGLIDLYESDFDPAWLRRALELNDVLAERFADREKGGYFTTGSDHEQLIARLKSPVDGALPSGNGVQALNLLRLAELVGDPALAAHAERCLRAAGKLASRYPVGFSQLLLAADFLAAGPREVVIAGEAGEPSTLALLRAVRSTFVPQRVVALASEGADAELMPILAGKSADAGGARAYVCRNYACDRPVASADELLLALR